MGGGLDTGGKRASLEATLEMAAIERLQRASWRRGRDSSLNLRLSADFLEKRSFPAVTGYSTGFNADYFVALSIGIQGMKPVRSNSVSDNRLSRLPIGDQRDTLAAPTRLKQVA